MAQPLPDPRLAHALAWAELSALINLQLSPLGLHAIAALTPLPGEVILDIGCGTGQTVVQLADQVGAGGKVIGVDIAPLLLDIARERAAGLHRRVWSRRMRRGSTWPIEASMRSSPALA
jgi:SAM-dependent methyltransferase